MNLPDSREQYSVAFTNATSDIAQLRRDVTEILVAHPDLSLDDPFTPRASLNRMLGMIAGIESVQVSLAPDVDPVIMQDARYFVIEE